MKRAKREGEGRPSIFTKDLSEAICQRIASGESLRSICKDDNMPERTTVHLWLIDKEKEEFFNQYEKSCNTRAENMFDELVEIADDGSNDYMERENKDGSSYTTVDSEHIQRSRLRVDTRKWYLSKVLPKKYGDRQILAGDEDSPLKLTLVNYADNKGTIPTKGIPDTDN